MIFFLEVDGQLKKCMVKEPYCSLLRSWNALNSAQNPASEGYEFSKDSLRSLARECVQAGAYEVRE